jgi:hypothetical protein
MSGAQKEKGVVLEVKKSAGQVSLKLGRKKSIGDKVASALKGK